MDIIPGVEDGFADPPERELAPAALFAGGNGGEVGDQPGQARPEPGEADRFADDERDPEDDTRAAGEPGIAPGLDHRSAPAESAPGLAGPATSRSYTAYLIWAGTPPVAREPKTLDEFKQAWLVSDADIALFETQPQFPQHLASATLDWLRSQVPSVILAALKNSLNDKRPDQHAWIEAVLRMTRTIDPETMGGIEFK